MRTEKLVETYKLDVVYVQFPLHPETPDEGRTLADLFAGSGIDIAAAQVRLARICADEGLTYGDRTMTYNSRRAQEVAKWAETQPGGAAIHSALFRAYFVDGVNLARVEELERIVAGVGLSPGAAREALENARFADAVDADWARSRALGVTGVPTYVAGNTRAVGAQPYSVLEQLVRGAGARKR